MNGARGTEDDGVQQAHGVRDWEASVAVGAVPLVAQGPGVIILITVVALLLLAALFFVLRGGDEQLEEQERPEIDEGERPTDDLLEEREEVDEPVEDYEDMSLAEIKKAKMARVEGKGEGRETAGEATERAREEHVEEDEGEVAEEPDREEAEEPEGEEPAEEETDEAETEREAKEPSEEAPADEETDEAADDEVEEAEADEPEKDEESETDDEDDDGGFGLPSPGEVSEASEVEADEESDEEDEDSGGEGLPTPSSFAEDTDDDAEETGETVDEEAAAEADDPADEDAEAEADEEADEEAAAEEERDDEREVEPSEAAAEEGDEPEEDAEGRDEVGADEPEPEEEEGDEASEKRAEEDDESDDGDGGEGGDGSGGASGETASAAADADESEDEADGDVEDEPREHEETSAEGDEELPEDIDDAEAEPKSFEKGLEKTREGFIQQLSSLFSGEELSEEMVEEVEEVLFSADIGPRVAQDILDAIEEQLSGEELDDPGKVWGFIRHYTEELLETHEEPLDPSSSDPPFVALVVGVNGVGKTTTIGKMASRFKRQGHSVLLVAGDTYRAAAVDQLGIWAERTGLPMHSGDEGADPASVIYSGIERAVEEDIDVVLCDTSGRLHTDVNLMEELEKMERVAGNAKEGAPDEVHLVLDANTGQNAIQQAEKFNESLDVSGITLTKFDGTARGGVILGVCKRFDAPIRYVGIGERIVDLREFDAGEFVEALFM